MCSSLATVDGVDCSIDREMCTSLATVDDLASSILAAVDVLTCNSLAEVDDVQCSNLAVADVRLLRTPMEKGVDSKRICSRKMKYCIRGLCCKLIAI